MSLCRNLWRKSFENKFIQKLSWNGIPKRQMIYWNLYWIGIYSLVLKKCSNLLMIRLKIVSRFILSYRFSSIGGITTKNYFCFSSELGQQLSFSFKEVDDECDQLIWYSFPIGIQRLLPVTMANVQQPVVVKCFGNILWSRDQFKKESSINQSPFAIRTCHIQNLHKIMSFY